MLLRVSLDSEVFLYQSSSLFLKQSLSLVHYSLPCLGVRQADMKVLGAINKAVYFVGDETMSTKTFLEKSEKVWATHSSRQRLFFSKSFPSRPRRSLHKSLSSVRLQK